LNYERLQDYDASEEKLNSKFRESRDENKTYELMLNRFYRPRTPIAFKALEASPWPQIPLFGSLIIPIFPVKERDFLSVHQFEARDIGRLVDFCKDTGRIQFALGSSPTSYLGLDYLDVILEELRPPLTYVVPIERFADLHAIVKWADEFDVASSIAFWSYLKGTLQDQGFSLNYAKLRYENLRNAYVYLKALGYYPLAQRVFDTLVTDPYEAHKVLYFSKQFIINPLTGPAKTISCFSLDYLKLMKEVDSSFGQKTETIRFPTEIGTFLMKQMTLVPESFEACRDVIHRFDQHDVLGVVNALNDAIASSNLDLATAKATDLNTLLSSIWQDSRHYGRRIQGLGYGVELILGACGFLAGQTAGGVSTGLMSGLLTYLGFKVLDDSESRLSERIGKQIMKIASPNYTSAIFDFRTRHNLE